MSAFMMTRSLFLESTSSSCCFFSCSVNTPVVLVFSLPANNQSWRNLPTMGQTYSALWNRNNILLLQWYLCMKSSALDPDLQWALICSRGSCPYWECGSGSGIKGNLPKFWKINLTSTLSKRLCTNVGTIPTVLWHTAPRHLAHTARHPPLSPPADSRPVSAGRFPRTAMQCLPALAVGRARVT